jgi:Zn-dependent protease with chaperone function
MYYLLGISLTLAFLLIVNIAVAGFASLFWKAVSSPVQKLSVTQRTKMIFGLRIFPIAAALLFVLAFIVPAYVLHEPSDSGEVVSTKLALIATLCVLGMGFALFRVLGTFLATRRLMRSWLQNSSEMLIDGVTLPVSCIEHPFPVLAVVGILRPRIFVARQVLDSLTGHELKAAFAHEYGHLKARDNLKRTLLRVCRDLLIVPVGRGLDHAWAQNAEVVADEFAAAEGNACALDLASALIKITRIVPEGVVPALPVGAYIITDRDGDVSSRIKRLLRISSSGGRPSPPARRSSAPSYVWSFGFALLLALHFADRRLLLTAHEAIEHFVWIIQ